MIEPLNPTERAKYASGYCAADFVQDGMRVGLGTGSTAAWLVKRLGARVRHEGLRLMAVPTSRRIAALAREEGINVVSLDEARWLDLTIDGADEFDAELNLIKGGGGALLHEKIVATASDQLVVITDVSKEVKTLGAFPLPVEVVPFGWQASQALIEEMLATMDVMGRQSTLRMNGDTPYLTEEGNYILDLALGRIGNPRQLALVLNQVPGVIENGLFVDMADQVVIGHPDGSCEMRDLSSGVAEVSIQQVDLGEAANIFSDI